MQLDLRHRVAVHLAQEILRQFVRQANPLPLKVNSDRSSAKGVTVCRQADHFSNLFGCQGLALHERIRNCSDLPPAVFYETPSLENSDVQPSRGDFVRSRDVSSADHQRSAGLPARRSDAEFETFSQQHHRPYTSQRGSRFAHECVAKQRHQGAPAIAPLLVRNFQGVDVFASLMLAPI